MSEIKLGMRVRCRVSRFEGIATSRHVDYTGQVQIGVQPQVDPSKIGDHPDAICIDIDNLEVTDAVALTASAISPPSEFNVQVGEDAECVVTGFRGIAARRNEFLNGCVIFMMQAKANKDGKVPEHRTSHLTIKRVGAGVTKLIKPAAKGAEAPRRTGGPSGRVSDQ